MERVAHSSAEQSKSAERTEEDEEGYSVPSTELLELRRTAVWEFMLQALNEIEIDTQLHDLIEVEKGENPSHCSSCDRIKAVLRSAIEMNRRLNGEILPDDEEEDLVPYRGVVVPGVAGMFDDHLEAAQQIPRPEPKKQRLTLRLLATIGVVVCFFSFGALSTVVMTEDDTHHNPAHVTVTQTARVTSVVHRRRPRQDNVVVVPMPPLAVTSW